eukprot:325631_1
MSSFTSIVMRIFSSRNEMVSFISLNGLCALYTSLIHFIIVYQYINGNGEKFNHITFLYFHEIILCIFLWNIQILDTIKHFTHDLYWLILLLIYLYLIFIFFAVFQVNAHYWSIQWLISVLCIIQFLLSMAMLCIYYYCNLGAHYWLSLLRSVLLILLIIVAAIPWFLEPDKLWIFSFLLIQYLNLHVADFILPTTIPQQYRHLHSKRKDVFESMISCREYYKYKPLKQFNIINILCINLMDDIIDIHDWDTFDIHDWDRLDMDCNCCDTSCSEYCCEMHTICYHICYEYCCDYGSMCECCRYTKCDECCECTDIIFWLCCCCPPIILIYILYVCFKCFIYCYVYTLKVTIYYITHVDDTSEERVAVFDIETKWNQNKYDDLYKHIMQCYETNQLLVIQPSTNDESDQNNANHLTLTSGYELNQICHFDESLFSLIFRAAKYYQQRNKYFNTDCIAALIIFLKFSTFRLLLNHDLLTGADTFTHFYHTLAMNSIPFLDVETRMGYTILISQISSRTPIIFSNSIKSICDFAIRTSKYSNMHQGVVFPVEVHGRFVDLSFFGRAFKNIFIVIGTKNMIQIIPNNSDRFNHSSETAEQLTVALRLARMVADNDMNGLKKNVRRVYHLITTELLSSVLLLYGTDLNDKSKTKFLIDHALHNENLMVKFLFNRKYLTQINLQSICSPIWLQLVSNVHIDELSVVKLRKKCRELQKEQIPGKMLLNYKSNGILIQIPEDIKHIKWATHIEHYISNDFFGACLALIPIEPSEMEKERIQKFLGIMHSYNEIVNHQNMKEDKFKKLFDLIDDEFNMSDLMDVMFDMKHGNVNDSYKIAESYQCKFKTDCNIKMNILKTRDHKLLSRALGVRKETETNGSTDHQYSHMNSEDYSKMEVLNLIHVRMFHTRDDEPIFSSRPDIITSQIDFEKDALFKDNYTNKHLIVFEAFCKREEYDTEAIYDDLFPDNDGQSNIYHLFKNKEQTEMNYYYHLKEQISKYTINPPDKLAINRNLIELDFGDHIIHWDVKPKFYNMKEEWFENEFFPIQQDLYDSLHLKSEIVTNTKKKINLVIIYQLMIYYVLKCILILMNYKPIFVMHLEPVPIKIEGSNLFIGE